jgi:H+/gluconate symporter-like permease
MVETPQDPAAVAGMVLAVTTAMQGRDPLEPVLDDAGLATTLRLLTTGDLPPAVLAAYAEIALRTPITGPATDALITAFGNAGIPSTPYAYALDPTGETTLPLIETDPMHGQAADPILRDSAWISLQGICRG